MGDEMTMRAVRVALLLPALSAVGCGTAANLIGAGPGAKVPFGGVAHDVQCLRRASSGELGVGPLQAPDSQPNPRVGSMLLCAADLPFSLVADAVMWPYTCAYTYVNAPTDYPALLLTPPAPGLPTVSASPATPAPAVGRPETAPPGQLTPVR